jgi:hypothetical protein
MMRDSEGTEKLLKGKVRSRDFDRLRTVREGFSARVFDSHRYALRHWESGGVL